MVGPPLAFILPAGFGVVGALGVSFAAVVIATAVSFFSGALVSVVDVFSVGAFDELLGAASSLPHPATNRARLHATPQPASFFIVPHFLLGRVPRSQPCLFRPFEVLISLRRRPSGTAVDSKTHFRYVW
jgi:hypothetical protein